MRMICMSYNNMHMSYDNMNMSYNHRVELYLGTAGGEGGQVAISKEQTSRHNRLEAYLTVIIHPPLSSSKDTKSRYEKYVIITAPL